MSSAAFAGQRPVPVRLSLLRQLRSRCSAVLPLFVVTTACGSLRQTQVADSESANNVAPVGQSERHWDKRPSLIVIERNGDPVSALAFAAKTTVSPVAVVTFANILNRRLAEPNGSFEIFPNSFGLTLVGQVTSPEEAVIATQSVENALSSPVDPKLLDENTIEQVRRILGVSLAQSEGELALASCSGEFLVDSKQLDILNNKTELYANVERARIEMHSRNSARFAFVGTRNTAHAVEHTLSKFRTWPFTPPVRQAAVESIRNPEEISISRGNQRGLSIAWRVASIETASRAAQALRKRGSPLLAQVAALDTEWKVDSVSAIARNVGACLRIDFSTGSDTAAISLANLESTVRMATSESRSTLRSSTVAVHEVLVNPGDNDPRSAARRAAWNSLSSSVRSFGQALQIHLRTSQVDGPSGPLESALRDSLAARPPSPLEAVHRLESGQSEQWALLASPCGTLAESADDSGSTAAWVRAVAKRYSGHLGVQVEPWLTVDGVGFIAHCPTQSQAESPSALATRLGNALGSIIATGSVNGAELAAIREDALLRVGPAPRRAWWQLVDLLSPDHPSCIEPLGSFDSIRKLDLANIRASRLRWLHGPLRLSTLLNQSENQLEKLTFPLHRWLDPHRAETKQCAQLEQDVEQSRDVQYNTRSLDARDSNVYVAIRLAPDLKENLIYEHWLLWLLTRPSGWIEKALDQLGSLHSVSAEVEGPRQRRSLIVGLNVADESKVADCILRLRTLFSRLADSGADSQDVRLAQRWSDAQIRRAELDPRRRLVDLWRGDSVPQKTQLSGFSRYLNQSFNSAAVTVVRVGQKP